MSKVSIVVLLEHAVIAPRFLARACPSCRSLAVRTRERESTTNARPHTTETCECGSCALRFERHDKEGNVWHVSSTTRAMIAGVATCYEDFHYKCACGPGLIRRRHTDMDGVTPARALRFTVGGPKHFRIFWTCDACAWSVETDEDHATDAHANQFAEGKN